jgi:hypothetical protein
MCEYQGYEFGASYPDSVCIEGKLYDADDCDDEGRLYEPDEDVPCPMCRPSDAVTWWARQDGSGKPYSERRAAARKLVADIRKNRRKGTEPWKTAT